jgi:hypothetical protein
MATNPQGEQRLAKWSRLPMERITYIPHANEATVRSIRRGILYLMAYWSIYSVQAFAKLTEVVARLDADGLEFVVVDVDDSPGLYAVPELKGKLSQGAGETIWVRDGKIIATSGLGLNAACFKPNTLVLLSLP